MSSRHTRRKLARERQSRKLEGLAKAARSAMIAKIVRDNKSHKPERNYYPSSPMGRLGENAARAKVSGGITHSRAGKIDSRGGKRKFVPER